MATVESAPESTTDHVRSGLTDVGIVLEGVSWETYERLLTGLGDRRVFVTYDRGTMEIQTVSPSYKHENDDRFLELIIATVCVLTDTPMRNGGSVTMRRADLEKGLEADGSFWIAKCDELNGVVDLDLTKHPAPDLVVEVDIHASSVSRIEAYQRLGVTEVWWLREREGLVLLARGESGEFEEVEASVNLPILTRKLLAKALSGGRDQDETSRLNAVLKQLGLR